MSQFAEADAHLVPNYDAIKKPGDFAYYVKYGWEVDVEYGMEPPFVGMIYNCPCGCGSRGSLPFIKYREPDNPKWGWDGNVETPTLKPSIRHSVGDGKGGMIEHWHGFLTNGRFVSC